MGFFDELSGNAIAPITDTAIGRAGTRTAGNVDQLINEDPMSRALFDQMQMERLAEETYKADSKLVNQFSVEMLAIERAVEQIFKSGMAAGADASELVATSFDAINSVKMDQNYAAADLHTTDYKRQVTNLDAQRNATAGVVAGASAIAAGLAKPGKPEPTPGQMYTDDPGVTNFIEKLNSKGDFEGLTRPARSWDPDETLGGPTEDTWPGIATIGTWMGKDRGRPYMHTDEERAARSFPVNEKQLGSLPLARTAPGFGETHINTFVDPQRGRRYGVGASYALPVPSWFNVAENIGEE